MFCLNWICLYSGTYEDFACKCFLKKEVQILNTLKKGTSFAAAQTEGSKPILTGINISIKNNILQFVGIDGYRLAIKREPVKQINDLEFKKCFLSYLAFPFSVWMGQVGYFDNKKEEKNKNS